MVNERGEVVNERTRPILGQAKALAFEPLSNSMADLERNSRIQAARDVLPCIGCGHRSLSHAYGRRQSNAVWPDGSRIGRGECGYDGTCPCREFA